MAIPQKYQNNFQLFALQLSSIKTNSSASNSIQLTASQLALESASLQDRAVADGSRWNDRLDRETILSPVDIVVNYNFGNQEKTIAGVNLSSTSAVLSKQTYIYLQNLLNWSSSLFNAAPQKSNTPSPSTPPATQNLQVNVLLDFVEIILVSQKADRFKFSLTGTEIEYSQSQRRQAPYFVTITKIGDLAAIATVAGVDKQIVLSRQTLPSMLPSL